MNRKLLFQPYCEQKFFQKNPTKFKFFPHRSTRANFHCQPKKFRFRNISRAIFSSSCGRLFPAFLKELAKKTANIFARTKLFFRSNSSYMEATSGMCLLCEVVSTVDSVLVVQCEWYAAHIHVTHL
jgi:hypothetical protein